jgi:NADH-quinone oxidoreductase subunit L
MTFFGEYRGHEHPHESPAVMTVPLAVLALLSIGGGFLFKIPDFLGTIFPTLEVPEDTALMLISTSAGIIGIGVAWYMYVARPGTADALAKNMKGLYTLVYNKYFVDEVYDATVVKPVVNGSRVVLWKGMDAGLIDGIVNGAGTTAQGVGGVLRRIQSGNIRSYATWVLLGSVLVIVTLGIAGGLR